MAVERRALARVLCGEEGQSLFEFLLMLPLLLGLTVLLIRLNSAIQISIVNQRYARAQALALTENNSIYPRLGLQLKMIERGNNQMILGVSENVPPSGEGDYVPKATVQLIARTKRVQASDAPREEPNLRANVRVRNTVTLCAPTLFTIGQGTGPMPILPMGGAPIRPIARSNLSEATRFNNICGSLVKYE